MRLCSGDTIYHASMQSSPPIIDADVWIEGVAGDSELHGAIAGIVLADYWGVGDQIAESREQFGPDHCH